MQPAESLCIHVYTMCPETRRIRTARGEAEYLSYKRNQKRKEIQILKIYEWGFTSQAKNIDFGRKTEMNQTKI
jgi:hypothetical protein